MRSMRSAAPRSALAALALAVGACPTDGGAATFTVINDQDAGPGSLRQAILDANQTPGSDTIEFAIPGAGPHTIELATALPSLSSMTIDGLTQPGAMANTVPQASGGLDSVLQVNLTRAVAAAVNAGLVPTTNATVTVRGLALFGFAGSGIAASNAGSRLQVENCHLGVTADGEPVSDNQASGVAISGVAVTAVIGGALPGQRNLVSGNRSDGILVNGGVGSTTIQGNLIGTSRDGAQPLGNGRHGVHVNGVQGVDDALHVGGAAAGEGNVISGNAQWAVALYCNGGASTACLRGARIEGNLVGWNGTGTMLLPSGGGTALSRAIDIRTQQPLDILVQNNRIGSHGTGVRIAGNNADDSRNARVTVRDNDFTGTTVLDIDLAVNQASTGRDLNDSGDADVGINHLQNFPELATAEITDLGIRIDVRVDSTPEASRYPFSVDLYHATAGHAVRGLGSANYTAAQAGILVSTDVAVPTGLPRLPLVAIVRDADGRVSEFSEVVGEDVFVDGFE